MKIVHFYFVIFLQNYIDINNNGEILTEDLEMHFIQIPKAEKEKIKTTLDLWIRFIGNIKDEEVEKMKYEVNEETMNAVMKAQEEYWKIMADPETRRIAELREKAIRDEVTNINGTKREIARKLKEEKVDIEIIIKTTGLTKEEIERL
ncbi:MAG: PD-(D/E)XK nuclease family transposase [Clostridia bacterium]|nr:PD-(D/E)XK nuclease family transposase [Clostridia bacterium]